MIALLLLGCGLSAKDVGAFVAANDDVVPSVQGNIDPIEQLVSTERHGQGDGDYQVDGAIDGDGTLWTGTLDVTGTGTSAQGGTILSYALTVDYQGVQADGVGLDGEVTLTIASTLSPDKSTFLYTLAGTLEASGDVEGTADVDYDMYAETGATRWVHSGTVAGRAVDD